MREKARPARSGGPMLPQWELEVGSALDLTPQMRRIGGSLVDFSCFPEQSLMLQVPAPEGGAGRREYTIRSVDPARREIAFDFLLHGPTPGPQWARTAAPGSPILTRGPRGRTVFAEDTDGHLFLGDETGIPAILHILEKVPVGTRAFAFIDVAGPEDDLPTDTAAELSLEWVHRDGHAVGPPTILL